MENPKFTLLAVDDDATQLELLRVICEKIEFPFIEYLSAETGTQGLETVESRSVDLVLTDYRLPDINGLEVLKRIKADNPLVSVVVMTAFEDARDAVHILQNGGDDYLVKPTRKDEIEHLIVRIFEKSCVVRENQIVQREIEESFDGLSMVVFQSRAMQQVLNLVSRSARSDAIILITGESGTGKELMSRLIHKSSLRKEQPFVTVNIAALPESLMESELFGHAKGSFTGADQDRAGRFEEADGGSLFIDEVGDIPPSIQVKLLRAIQFGQIQRLGENHTRQLNVRIIAATNRDLEGLVAEGSFRTDLYWRLNVVNVTIPPLRARKEDIPPLVEHFIRIFNLKNNRSIQGITREALDLLMRLPFHGNVRELENMIERGIIMARGTHISLRDLESAGVKTSFEDEIHQLCDSATGTDYQEKMNGFEKQLITCALREAKGNQSEAARRLKISERRLRSRLEILGIHNSPDQEPAGSGLDVDVELPRHGRRDRGIQD